MIRRGLSRYFFGFPFLRVAGRFWFLACSLRTKPRTEKSSATVLVRKPRPDPTQLEFLLNIYFTTLCLTFKKVLGMDEKWVFRDAEAGRQNPRGIMCSLSRPIRTVIFGAVARVWRAVALLQILVGFHMSQQPCF